MRLWKNRIFQLFLAFTAAFASTTIWEMYQESKKPSSVAANPNPIVTPLGTDRDTNPLIPEPISNNTPLASSIDPLTVNSQVVEPNESIESKILTQGALYNHHPSSVNGGWQDIEKATKAFSKFDYVIFGAGIEIPIDPNDVGNVNEIGEHKDKHNTIQIIRNLKGKTKVFGYINLGNDPTKPGISGHTRENLAARVQAWYEMGVYGIFWDEVSVSYFVDYPRFEYAINECRARNLTPFINSDNPTFTKSSGLLQEGDYVLIEPFAYTQGKPNPGGIELAKLYCNGWAQDKKVNVAGVSTCDIDKPDQVETVRSGTIDAALTVGVTSIIVTEDSYGVNRQYKGKLLPPRSGPIFISRYLLEEPSTTTNFVNENQFSLSK